MPPHWYSPPGKHGTLACPHIPPSAPVTYAAHTFAYAAPHGYHHMACGADRLRFARHEAIAAVLAAHLKPEGPFRIDLRKNLSSSTTGGTKVNPRLTST